MYFKFYLFFELYYFIPFQNSLFSLFELSLQNLIIFTFVLFDFKICRSR